MQRGGIGSLARYENLTKIGEGTYGFVYQGRDRVTGQTVALKKLLIYKESSGFPLSAIREIKFLNSLKHPNVVNLREIVTSKGCEQLESELARGAAPAEGSGQGVSAHPHAAATGGANVNLSQCGNLYLVFDYIEHDLAGLIDVRYRFNGAEIQSLMRQLFEALDFLHSRSIMHRDVKPSNLLVSQRLKLQLADFGLARSTDALRHNVPVLGREDGPDWCCDYQYHTAQAPAAAIPRGKSSSSTNSFASSSSTCSIRRAPPIEYTNNVVTLWYRPPELLLGAQSYGCGVDIWSAGCVFAEMLVMKPLFPGKTEAEQFDMICKTIGTPTEAAWSDIFELPDAMSRLMSCAVYSTNIRTSLGAAVAPLQLDLLERLLCADPGKRSSARLALGNRYFVQPQGKSGDADMLKIDHSASFHEYQTKKRKFEEARQQRESQELQSLVRDIAAAASRGGPVGAAGVSAAPGRV